MMQKLKTFFRTLFLSSTSPKYYKDIVAAPASFSWKYFFSFQLLSTFVVITTIILVLSRLNLPLLGQQVKQLYPQDLEVKIQNGKLSINKPLPYIITEPDFMTKQYIQGASSRGNLVVFNTDSSVQGVPDVKRWNSPIVVTESTIYVIKPTSNTELNEVRVYEVPKTPEALSITSGMINSGVQKFLDHPFIAKKLYVPVFAGIMAPVIYVFVVVLSLLTIFFYTIPTWLLAKVLMMTKKFSFGTLFRIGFHAITPVVIVSTMVDYLGISVVHGWLFFLAYLIWILIGLSRVPGTAIRVAQKKAKK